MFVLKLVPRANVSFRRFNKLQCRMRYVSLWLPILAENNPYDLNKISTYLHRFIKK